MHDDVIYLVRLLRHKFRTFIFLFSLGAIILFIIILGVSVSLHESSHALSEKNRLSIFVKVVVESLSERVSVAFSNYLLMADRETTLLFGIEIEGIQLDLLTSAVACRWHFLHLLFRTDFNLRR